MGSEMCIRDSYNTLEVIHLAAYKNNDLQVAAMAELLGKNLQYGLRGTTEVLSGILSGPKPYHFQSN